MGADRREKADIMEGLRIAPVRVRVAPAWVRFFFLAVLAACVVVLTLAFVPR